MEVQGSSYFVRTAGDFESTNGQIRGIFTTHRNTDVESINGWWHIPSGNHGLLENSPFPRLFPMKASFQWIGWIGLREHLNRKPWIFQFNMGLSCKFSFKPIHWSFFPDEVYKTYTCEVVCNLRGHQSKVPSANVAGKFPVLNGENYL